MNSKTQLSAAKRALLEKRLAGRVSREADEQTIRRGPRNGPVPLSFAQQRLWFLDQLEPGLVAYNIPAAVRLVGQVDVAVLNWSLNEIVRRHESLRTTFDSINGQPVQIIAPALELTIRTVDLTGLPDEARETEAMRLSREEAQRPFDLIRGPLIRAVLLRVGSEEHVLILTMHHIISDGWSQGVLKRELSALYEAGVKGEHSPLPELSIQYADFAQWQRGWLKDDELDRQVAYWRKQLSGAPPSVDLPNDGARPPQLNYRGATFLFELSAELSESLTALSRREGSTLFMTLLAAFKALLFRYTGQSDLVVGTPVANRNREELEGLIGFFVNTLALRTDLSHEPTFRELLHRVREVSLSAYAHQDLPFELLVEATQPVRDLSRNPIFQIAFDLQNAPDPALELTRITLQPHEFTAESTRFDLELHLTSTPERMLGAIVYSTNLFAEPTIRQIAERYRMLLEAVVANPEQQVSRIELLTSGERNQLLFEWNDTARSFPDKNIPDLFETWAARAPDKVALAFGDERVTYEELNRRANQLAHYLQTYGAGAETRIGIYIERSVEMIVAVLGVLKAGATYVPLDPSYPPQRLLFMLDDSEVQLVLSVAVSEEKLPAHHAPVILLDSDWPLIASHSDENPERNITPEHLAYISYTSGSTGTPKGVAVPHRGVVRLISGDYAQFGPDEVFLQFAPLAFDASTFEIWGSLLNGAQLVLMPAGMSSLGDLGRALSQNRVTTLWLTAGLFHQMVNEQLEALTALKQLLAGGDVLSPSPVRKFIDAAPSCRLINGYGPTENTTFTCCYVIDECNGAVPIGRPIAGTQVFILDENLQLAPPGFTGELYAGGAGLARGYHGRASLTAERFIPHPFSTEPGARLYRTGDLARHRADGNIEFIGRADEQVKVRGYRIELGEVETAIARVPGVQQVVVVVRDYGDGDKRLLAYVAGEVAVDKLRKNLDSTLPDYMVPSAFVVLDELPLTPNGKVDRRALPAPDEVHASPDSATPRTPVEELLAGIWADVLKVESVGVNDNFFELGGHSLLVTQLVSRAQAQFGAELPLKLFFESATLGAQAAAVEGALGAEGGLQAPPIVPVARTGNLPLSFSQQRLWFLYQLEPSTSAYNIPTAVRLSGVLDSEALRRTLNELVRRHEILRTYYGMADGKPVQFVGPPPELEIDLTDISELNGNERESRTLELASEEAGKPFDLTRPPLLRASLVRLGPEEHVLLLTVHHIVSDGWSQGVMVREVGKLYQAFSEGRESPLEELPVQYADFAHWRRKWLAGDVLDQQLAYWRKQLAGDLPVLDLPTDHPRPEVQSFRGATLTTLLPQRLSESLGVICRREGVTLFMLLLAAFKTLLCRYTGQDEIVIGAPIANRNNIEIENLIGFFVNTLVLRTDLSGDPYFPEFLARVRKVTLEAYAHQDLPFEVLVEDLQPERSLSRNPLFQVMFQLENTPKEELPLPGLTLSPVAVEGVASQFDLSVDVVESEQGLAVVAEYSTDLFEAETIRTLLKRWEILLESIAAAPQQRLSEFSIIDESERRQIDPTAIAFPSQSVSELFEAQVLRSPAAVAMVWDGESITFTELNQRTNQLAHYLKSAGVGPEVPVALMLERSPEMIVALLAILKAGGAYVPLDPSYPQARLAFMLDDTGAPLILTQESLIGKLPEQLSARIVCIDRDAAAIGAQQTRNPDHRVSLDNAAYVIYTSGSTGTPKGVVITHRSLSNHCFVVGHEYELQASDRVLQFASLIFDVAAEEIFPTLLAGAAIVLQGERVPEAIALLRLVEQERVTVLNMSARFWQDWLESLDRKGARLPESVRLTATGSEKVLPEGVAVWSRLAPANSALLNAYGVSEATITSTLYRYNMDHVSGGQSLPIGRPIANTHAYVLDRNLNPVPTGLAGELYLAGVSLARGYHRRADLTAERFIPNPFGSTSGARLYRTGDLARYRADGNIEFIGRADEQIKLRGYRIELGEIEEALSAAPDVGSAAVLLRAGASGDPTLVAYVTQRPAKENGASVELETEQLAQWRTVHDDEVFNENDPILDPTLNISGWNSSYTDKPISAEEMREWVDDAVERVLWQQPRRVLEIGCGTGLLLFRIAPHCERYLGTDFSPSALKYIREQLHESLPQVSLSEQNAHDFTNIEPASFDAVIINSVVQYFPGVDYLMRVLRGAVEAVAPGGFIFIGDVRSLPLLKALHASVEQHKAGTASTPEQLRRRIEQEEELLIDPAFFTALKQHLPHISHVEVEPKRGRYHNELTRFRYQVMLHVGAFAPLRETNGISRKDAKGQRENLLWIDWREDHWDLTELCRRLIEDKPETLALTNVANARLGEGLDPEDLYRLSDSLPYQVHLSWARHGADGSFDVLFTQRSETTVEFPFDLDTTKALSDYVNDPLRAKQARQFGPQLRNFLKSRLPEHMIPASFVILDELPLLPNGKLDRRALPAPEAVRPDLPEAFVAPRPGVEQSLAGLWSDLLGLPQIGIHDNFFDLGGHSLLSTQLISRVRELFKVELPLREVFQQPTIAALAIVIEQAQNNSAPSEMPKIARVDRAARRLARRAT
ncbi:MAG TPA: amino acid adenylation domain-containing protein [Pyrinomonadaceae bacterium]|nr:amino acid adenylation domain-containing protein [Pyrinomonadaceae bacterium]